MTSTRSTPKRTPAQRGKSGPEAIKLLKEDHSKVSALFKAYEKAHGDVAKQRLCQKICLELTVIFSMRFSRLRYVDRSIQCF